MSNPTRRSARPAGEAVALGRTARHIDLRLQRLDDGRIRVSTPQARGHAVVVKGPLQLWHAVVRSFVEATVAGYATWRGVRYDLDELTDASDPTEPPRRRPYSPRETGDHAPVVSYSRDAAIRPDQVHPAEYTPNPDGSWNGPSGRRHRTPKMIRTIIINRARLGLPIDYQGWIAAGGHSGSPEDEAS